MVSIEAIKGALPLVGVLAEAGVDLQHDKARCPFHDDRMPSFTVKGERWRCWAGCGGGDIFDFTAQFYGLDFKGALNLLADKAGIKESKPLSLKDQREAQRVRLVRERRRRLVAKFRAWEKKEINEIAAIFQAYHRMRAKRTTYSEAELQDLAALNGDILYLEYVYFDILCRRDNRGKFELYKEGLGHGN